MTTLLIENVHLIQNDNLRLGHLLIRDSKIEKVSFEERFSSIQVDQKINGNGQYLIPGMIDVHIHGADGFDMMDGTIESVKAVSIACARTGCTSFLATSVTSSFEDLEKMIDNVLETVGREPGAQIVGLHLEGPYLNAKRKGMQNELFLRHPNLDEMKDLLSKS
ncbi:MAG TPA: amidohydrolase family protein, partial [Candidatus Angelobacter sp.]|nr:amidohydrolase family protein [Candidatus Angelobacter sp.]